MNPTLPTFFRRKPPEGKPIFKTVTEAKLALSSDRLGCVYWRKGEVFVVTAFGSGTFPIKEWKSE